MAVPVALVIDDSAETRDVYALILELEGFAVVQARNGQEGVARAVESRPDIIITDLSMPIMDGWETIRRLRADQRTRSIPIIVCSGLDGEHGLESSRADALLAKPCPLDALMVEVRRLLSPRAA